MKLSDLTVEYIRANPQLFWDKVMPVTESGCWIWTGSIKPSGYGHYTTQVDGKTGSVRAHRAAWMLENGPVPDGLVLDHLCRVRCCVNPKHLEAVTNLENIRRGNGRMSAVIRAMRRTHCPHGHPATPENTYSSRKSSGNKFTYRHCKVCRRELDRKRRELKRELRRAA